MDKDFFNNNEEIWGKVAIAAMAFFMVGLIFTIILKSIKHKSSLQLENGIVQFRNKSINLANANISFGKYGMPATGSQGSILYLSEEKQLLKIGIVNYTAENPNYYTKSWSMSVDCFMDKNDFATFLPRMEKKQKIEADQVNPFSRSEMVFELRRNVKTGYTILLFYAFLIIPSLIIALFGGNNYFIVLPLTLAGLGGFIYYITKQNKMGRGFYLTVQNGMIIFLDLKSKKELFTTSLNSITTDTYIIDYRNRHASIYYLTLKLKVPGFKTITVGQVSSWGKNTWKDKGLPIKWLTFSPPNYILDAGSWDKLAKAFGIKI